jgi:hypothetical protein
MANDVMQTVFSNNQFIMLLNFLQSVKTDPRIGPSHICIYVTLVTLYQPMYDMAIFIDKKELIRSAKISESTFHRAINLLQRCGYLSYCPSFDPTKNSTVSLQRPAKHIYNFK